MDIVLWLVQSLVAVLFLFIGAVQTTGRGLQRWKGFSDLPRPLTFLVGVTAILGALGLVLPMATGVWPWLTPLAALALTAKMLMSAGFHVRAQEWGNVLYNTVWVGLLTTITIGRWFVFEAGVS